MNGCTYKILIGDALARLKEMADESVHTWICSPPYWSLRDYGVAGQIGVEGTVEEYLLKLVEVFREARRVLRRDGTCWVNMGDAYTSGDRAARAPDAKNDARAMATRPETPEGMKPKDLIGLPWMLAFALRRDGWWLRMDNVWEKPNVQPESVDDRTTRSHEYVFQLTRAPGYYCDMFAVRQPVTGNSHALGRGIHKKSAAAGSGIRQNDSFSAAVAGLEESRNLRSVWPIPTAANLAAEHFATYPEALPALCIQMGTSEVGCCRKCGAQVSRIVKNTRLLDGQPAEDLPDSDEIAPGRFTTVRRTVGWELGCTCYAGPPVPCTVGDFFSGTGTTGAAAGKLGRNYIGVELNREYAGISDRRLAEVMTAHPEQPVAEESPAQPVQLALEVQ